jgi:DNA repair protein RadC
VGTRRAALDSPLRIDAAVALREIRAALAQRGETGVLATFLRRIRARSVECHALPLHEDSEVLRFLSRLGVVDAPRRSARAADQIARFIEDASRAGAAEPAAASVLLRGFASGIYGIAPEPVCGDVPQCERCPFAGVCRCRTGSGRDVRAYGPGESPRERLEAEGPSALSTDELVAIVAARTGRDPDARSVESCGALLRRAGGIRELAQRTVAELADGREVGRPAARAIVAAMELGRRWAAEPRVTGKAFRTGADFYHHYRLRLRDLKKEVFIAVVLDVKSRFLAEEVCSEGTLTSSLVHPREAFRRAVRESAAAIAFVHNHPSGVPQPSPLDRDLTARLVEVSRLLGIGLVDHVIVGEGGFFSFSEHGLLQ